jgi:hypothetical protein
VAKMDADTDDARRAARLADCFVMKLLPLLWGTFLRNNAAWGRAA